MLATWTISIFSDVVEWEINEHMILMVWQAMVAVHNFRLTEVKKKWNKSAANLHFQVWLPSIPWNLSIHASPVPWTLWTLVNDGMVAVSDGSSMGVLWEKGSHHWESLLIFVRSIQDHIFVCSFNYHLITHIDFVYLIRCGLGNLPDGQLDASHTCSTLGLSLW